MKILMILVATVLLSAPAWAANAVNFNVSLSGDNEVPPVETDTTGSALLHVDKDWITIDFKLDVLDGENVLGLAGAHLHCAPAGINGPVVVFLAGPFTPGLDGDFQLRGTLNDSNIVNFTCGDTIAELVESMLEGDVYLNVHSASNPGGLIRGQVE